MSDSKIALVASPPAMSPRTAIRRNGAVPFTSTRLPVMVCSTPFSTKTTVTAAPSSPRQLEPFENWNSCWSAMAVAPTDARNAKAAREVRIRGMVMSSLGS